MFKFVNSQFSDLVYNNVKIEDKSRKHNRWRLRLGIQKSNIEQNEMIDRGMRRNLCVRRQIYKLKQFDEAIALYNIWIKNNPKD